MTSRHTAARRGASTARLIVAAALAGFAAIGLVLWLRSGTTGELRPAIERGGWSGTAISCTSLDPNALSSLGRGEVLDLGQDPGTPLGTGRCRRLDGSVLDLSDVGVTWFAVGTASDREGVALAEVDADVQPARLVVEHLVPGDGCGVTADWRGRLVLLVQGPAEATAPAVRLVEVQGPC